MLLSDGEIAALCVKEELVISPFDPNRVQPASYDVTLGGTFRQFRHYNTSAIYPWDQQQTLMDSHTLREDSSHYTLHPGRFALATTEERILLPDYIAAQVGGKSSLGRLGLVVHATAGFIDPGFEGRITLELANMGELPIVLEKGMAIGQLLFMRLGLPALVPYQGKYQHQENTTESRYYENYEPGR